jgi:hypothetical protein
MRLLLRVTSGPVAALSRLAPTSFALLSLTREHETPTQAMSSPVLSSIKKAAAYAAVEKSEPKFGRAGVGVDVTVVTTKVVVVVADA